MRTLVIGRTGQLARSIAERSTRAGTEVVLAGRDQLDLAWANGEAGRGRIASRATELIKATKADALINAAAYTHVDSAEDEVAFAHSVNALAPGELADAARLSNIPFVHVSTDYVFDGTLDRPYRPDDPVRPINVYGQTKEAGERAVRTASNHYAILRTAWLTSPFGTNFVSTMLRVARTCREIHVVHDQIGSPTSALDLADAILDTAYGLIQQTMPTGMTHHATAQGACSWADFARLIFDESGRCSGPVAQIRDIATTDLDRRALRPANSRLDPGRFVLISSPWQPPQRAIVRRLLAEAAA